MRNTVIIIALVTICFLQSCIPAKPLKGNYTNNYGKITDLSFEEAWANTIEYIAKSGKTIKLIDKSSGLLITEPVRFTEETTTYEDKKGNLINPKALIVIECEQTYEQMGCEFPEMVRGSISFRVKPVGNKSSVSINLTTLEGWRIIHKNTELPLKQIYSTGVYEQAFLNSF